MLETFHFIVLFVAVAILVLILVAAGMLLSKPTNAATYPPIQSVCPDYWESDGSGNCIINANVNPCPTSCTTEAKGVSGNKINFSDSAWSSTGMSPLCSKKIWANKFGVQWDGVSNYGGCKV